MRAVIRFIPRDVSIKKAEGKVCLVIHVLRETPPSSKHYPMDAPRWFLLWQSMVASLASFLRWQGAVSTDGNWYNWDWRGIWPSVCKPMSFHLVPFAKGDPSRWI